MRSWRASNVFVIESLIQDTSNPAQFDLAAGDEAEDPDYGGVFGRQGALSLQAATEL